MTEWNTQDKAFHDIVKGIRDAVRAWQPKVAAPPVSQSAHKSTTKGDSSDDPGEDAVRSESGVADGADDDAPAALKAKLTVSSHLDLIQGVGCPCLVLRLIGTSKRPAKIKGAELGLRGAHLLPAFQEAFNNDFDYMPVPGPPNPDDSFFISFLPAGPPNSPHGFVIERDDFCHFYLPAMGFPLPLFAQAPPEDVTVVVDHLDERKESVLSGADIQLQLASLINICDNVNYKVNPGIPICMGIRTTSASVPRALPVGAVNPKPLIFPRLPDRVSAPPYTPPELTEIIETIWTHFDPATKKSKAVCPRDQSLLRVNIVPSAIPLIHMLSARCPVCGAQIHVDRRDDPRGEIRPWSQDEITGLIARASSDRTTRCPADGTRLDVTKDRIETGTTVRATCWRCGQTCEGSSP